MFCKLFKDIATYGKELVRETFYGFRLHVKINSAGIIQTFELVVANVHDIRMLVELTEGDNGILMADRVYLSRQLCKQLLERQGLELIVPTKYGEPTPLKPGQLHKHKQIRRLIETIGSQLTHNFHIKKIWAHDLCHLTNRICRKILAHIFCFLFCLQEGLSYLNFKTDYYINLYTALIFQYLTILTTIFTIFSLSALNLVSKQAWIMNDIPISHRLIIPLRIVSIFGKRCKSAVLYYLTTISFFTYS